MTFLVADAALDRHRAEHLADRRAQRLAAVEHTSTPCSTSRPRSTRSASRCRATVLFSVEPSQSPNMKELRAGSMRALFAFDPLRRAIVLVGGDKRDDWTGWYERNIPIAADLLDAHLASMRKESRRPTDRGSRAPRSSADAVRPTASASSRSSAASSSTSR